MSNTETLHHQDLLLGAHWHVPLGLHKPISKVVATAIAQSAKERVWVDVEGMPFCLKADHKFAAEGNASVHFGSREDLGNGKVPGQTLLYSAVLSCEEATRPLAWRFIFSQYLEHMLESPSDSLFDAPKPMIRGPIPLLCGFARRPYVQLTKDERNLMLMSLWLAGLELHKICLRGVQATKAKGDFPQPDPELFIELLDWTG